jgi:hypothetical protein
MKTNSGPLPDAELSVVVVAHEPEYVLGFPVHVAVTIRAGPNTAFNELVFADLTDLRECLGLRLRATDGTTVVDYVPKPIIEPEAGAFPGRLRPSEERRMLTDVSPLISTAIAEGEYQVWISYVSPGTTAKAEPVRWRFRRPTVPEATVLATLAADRASFPNWASWTTTRPQPAVFAGVVTPDNPLRLNLLLRRLFYGPEPLGGVDPAVLDVLTGLYEPERDALKAELFHARNDLARYRELRTTILTGCPGLDWWMRMLDEGGGILQTFRSH